MSKPDPFAQAVGRRISQFRRERGLTQKQLAEEIGVVRFVISNYENGKYGPGGFYLVRLAIALGVTTDELLGVRPGGLSQRLEALLFLVPPPYREPLRRLILNFFKTHRIRLSDPA